MEQYRRLQEEHLKEIKKARQKISQWEQFEADYTAVQARLQSLPDRLSHDVMVPLGRFAYMPGKLYHTNEILVLLGDNWFAHRTARQAMGVAERRKQYVVKQLAQEKQNLEDLEARYSFTAELQASAEDVVDIKEEYNPKEEERSRVRRAKKPPPHNPKEEEKGHGDVWSRLEQLEEEEKEFIKREAEEREREEEEEEEEREDEGDVMLPGQPPIIIPVLHTRTEDKKEKEEEEEEQEVSNDRKSIAARFTSPADIFRHYSHHEKEEEEEKEEEGCSLQAKKTVSWDPGLSQHGHAEEEEERAHSEVHGVLSQHRMRASKPHAVPFSGLVVERQPLLERAALSPPPTEQQQEAQRKVSRFKSARQGR